MECSTTREQQIASVSQTISKYLKDWRVGHSEESGLHFLNWLELMATTYPEVLDEKK